MYLICWGKKGVKRSGTAPNVMLYKKPYWKNCSHKATHSHVGSHFCETRWLPSKCMAFGPGHQLDGWQIENKGYSLYLFGVEILKRVESRWQDMTPLQHTFLPPPQTPPLSLSLSLYITFPLYDTLYILNSAPVNILLKMPLFTIIVYL